MKTKYIFILLSISFTIFGQNKFVGEYHKLLDLEDTLKNPPEEYLYNKCFTINSDSTFFYYEEENPRAFETSQRETIEGAWIAHGDTITFYNRNYRKPKGIEFKHIINQNFKGIRVAVKDWRGKDLDIDFCNVDSLSPDKNHLQLYIPYKSFHGNTVTIDHSYLTALHLRPKDFCSDFRVCDITLNLEDVKDGTLIEVTCHSTEMQIMFNGKQYILTRNILHEISTSCNMPDAWTDNFIKKK